MYVYTDNKEIQIFRLASYDQGLLLWRQLNFLYIQNRYKHIYIFVGTCNLLIVFNYIG